ncbi:MAG TPA: DUF2585 family protein [Methylomirabilota bacterium]|nr:DUF2585 family protein [Methylomirabilota bacterium]
MADEGPRSAIRAAWRPWTVAAAIGLTAVDALVLHLMGRRLWCSCGSPSPWAWDIWSSHNSQHLIDPYTFTHVLHGAVYYAVLRLLLGARRPSLRALLAVMIEVGWEIGENTNTVIAAYREATIALNYYGDSIANSVGDVIAFALGYTAVMRLPVWVSVVAFVAVEAALLLTIRDGLVLNIVMLLHPFSAIKTWQMGG